MLLVFTTVAAVGLILNINHRRWSAFWTGTQLARGTKRTQRDRAKDLFGGGRDDTIYILFYFILYYYTAQRSARKVGRSGEKETRVCI